MNRHLRRWLNDGALVRLGGAYEGIIASVTEETVRNRYTAQRELQPVIAFDDGWRLIPNLGMRAALIELFGSESHEWIGRRITITRRRQSRVNRTTGEVREVWVKAVWCEDKHARVLAHPAAGSQPGDWTPAERADYDDRTDDEVARENDAAGRRRAR